MTDRWFNSDWLWLFQQNLFQMLWFLCLRTRGARCPSNHLKGAPIVPHTFTQCNFFCHSLFRGVIAGHVFNNNGNQGPLMLHSKIRLCHTFTLESWGPTQAFLRSPLSFHFYLCLHYGARFLSDFTNGEGVESWWWSLPPYRTTLCTPMLWLQELYTLWYLAATMHDRWQAHKAVIVNRRTRERTQ